MTVSMNLTIFEGPDGSGKTTAARAFAEATDADYVHLGPFKKVGNIGRLYVEAMMPAILGHRSIVMDRCWMSEVPYGQIFRNGADRLGLHRYRSLERLAARCSTVVVKCLPSNHVLETNFEKRRHKEMLDYTQQLMDVATIYRVARLTDLPVVHYNYKEDEGELQPYVLSQLRTIAHRTSSRTAGFRRAQVLIAGDDFAAHKEGDPLYQWPFGSLSGSGSSLWLTNQLMMAGIKEKDLAWINVCAEPPIEIMSFAQEAQLVVALGDNASEKLTSLDIEHVSVSHPQYWKRFRSSEEYNLGATIKSNLKKGRLL